MEQNVVVNEENLVRGVSYDTEPEKTYLILIDGYEADDSETPFRDWQIVEGRQNAYDYIKNMLENEYVNIDINTSKVIVDTVLFKESISVYKFMKLMKDSEKVIDYTDFDIEDYNE